MSDKKTVVIKEYTRDAAMRRARVKNPGWIPDSATPTGITKYRVEMHKRKRRKK